MSGPHLPPYLVSEGAAVAFTSGIFLGFYAISAAFANRWLVLTDEGWGFRRNIRWSILATTNAIAVLVLLCQALVVDTSIDKADFVENGHRPEEYVEPAWKGIVECTATGVIALLADTILMYRLWKSHTKQMAVMWLPIILWLTSIACVIMQLYLQIANIHNPDIGPYKWGGASMNVGPGIVVTPLFVLTIVLSVYCSGFLAWQLWESLKHDQNDGTKQLQVIVRICMESGVLYPAMSIVTFFTYFGQDNFAIHMNETLYPVVIGIAYNLIITRVGQNRTEGESNTVGRNSPDKKIVIQVAHQESSEGSSISVWPSFPEDKSAKSV